jgi:DNA repair photolyase
MRRLAIEVAGNAVTGVRLWLLCRSRLRGCKMALLVKEAPAKSILSKSQVYPYTINAYTGCQHGCSYCYARFMKRVTGHKEPWGEFVDVKVNAADLLRVEIKKKKPARVWISGVCDPYQPLEARYKLTRQCLEILAQNRWPVTVQTRSPLVLRDIDLLKEMSMSGGASQNASLPGMEAPPVVSRGEAILEVGFSVTTADDEVRRLFEPQAPPIGARLEALGELHRAGIRTFAMVAPMLPGADGLGELLAGKVDYLLVDRLNYHYADWVYRRYGLEDKLAPGFFEGTERELQAACERLGIAVL